MWWKAAERYKNLMNQKTRHRNYCQHQEKKSMSSNWQCIRHQLYEFTTTKKFRNKRKRTKTIADHEKCKIKWNSKNHKRNKRDKYEHCKLSETDSVQWNENAETQDYARNELTTIT